MMQSITVPEGKHAELSVNGRKLGEIAKPGKHNVQDNVKIEIVDNPPEPEPTVPRERPVSDGERIEQLAKLAGKTLEQLDVAAKAERAVAARAS